MHTSHQYAVPRLCINRSANYVHMLGSSNTIMKKTCLPLKYYICKHERLDVTMEYSKVGSSNSVFIFFK